MGYIAAYFAQRAIDLVARDFGDTPSRRTDLLRIAGIRASEDQKSNAVIDDTAFFALLEYIDNHFDHGHTIAPRLGSTMRCNDYGAFGLAFKTAQNLAGSFLRVERYGRAVTSVANYQVQEHDSFSFMAINPGVGARRGLLLTTELAAAAGVALCREVNHSGFKPKAVYFSHSPPTTTEFHETYFNCPVVFNAGKDGFEVESADLLAVNRLGDDAVSAFFDTHLEGEIASIAAEITLEQRVTRLITQQLSEGVPALADIAKQLNKSGRTLQRRLSEENLIYQQLVDTARKELAVRLLQTSNYSLAEVAFLSGYAEQSTFTRAFKRWCGQTPTEFKRTARNTHLLK